MECKNISYLLLIKNPVSFIEACYRDLLGRTASPRDILDLSRLIEHGMPRSALIYCIVKSAEFGRRFSVEDISIYKRAYLSYKLQSQIKFRTLKKYSAAEPVSESCPTKPVFPLPSHGYIDHQALSLCHIAQLESHIKTLPEKTTVLTELTKIAPLLKSDNLQSFSAKLKDDFVFTMPSPPISDGTAAFIWEKGWHYTNDDCYFQSSSSQGRFILYNQSDSWRKAILRVHISTPEKGAELFIYLPSGAKICRLSSGGCYIQEPLYLAPFYNEFPILYIGNGVRSSCPENHLIRFYLESLSLSFTDEADNVSRDIPAVSHWTTEDLGDSYFPYLLSDSYIRTRLHKNGFFEVSACKFGKSRETIPLRTTRFDYLSDSRNGSGFYTYCTGRETEAQAGVLLYTARRGGRLSTISPEVCS